MSPAGDGQRRLPSLPRWLAHRCGGHLAPENTLLGIRRAAALGYRAVEFDVTLSGDGTPVLFHDETLERTTNGRGRVGATADELLFRLDAGDGERIPTLAEAGALCRELGLLANVEIKPARGMEVETAKVVTDQVRRDWQGAVLLPLLSSFSLEAMRVARERAAHLPRGLLFGQLPADYLELAAELQAVALHLSSRIVSPAVVDAAHRRGLAVLVYTVNDAAAARELLALGVDALFTDNLDGFATETSVCNSLHLPG